MTLTPTFDPEVLEYSVATSNNTNTVTATTDIADATITIMLGETEVENGDPATWEAGENTLTITVAADGYETVTYTVTVTKS